MSAGTGTQVDFPGMRDAAAYFADGVNRCEREVKNFDTTVSQLSVDWGGESAKLFMGFVGEFKVQFNRVIRALDAMHDALLGTEGHYSSNEYNAPTLISPLAGALGGIFD